MERINGIHPVTAARLPLRLKIHYGVPLSNHELLSELDAERQAGFDEGWDSLWEQLDDDAKESALK